MPTKLLNRALFPSICWRCESRALSALSTSKQAITQPPKSHHLISRRQRARFYATDAPLKLNYVLLPSRTLISLEGPDATDFLHNLIPAPVLPLSDQSSCLATALLNAKGRIIHDVFLYKPSQSNSHRWLLEVDTNSAPALLKHLKKHKLRAKFKLHQLSPDEAAVFYLWPRSTHPNQEPNLVVNQDPRPKMGSRGYFEGNNASQTLKEMFASHAQKEEYHWEDYMIHRFLNGHAEGPVEILSEHALPQESNFDFYGGIDFHKGCYLGQELTIRTHHTGVVRKRILPVQLYNVDDPIPKDQTRPLYNPLAALPQPPSEANVAKSGARGRSGRSTGKWLGGYGNIGLALCRLETMTDLSVTAEPTQYNPEDDEFEVTWKDGTSGEAMNVKVKAFVPPWLRQGIADSVKARSEKSQARRRKDPEEEEEDVD